ncbi:MAG: hypothetical protein DRI98_08065 [Bacteroidetes bacterium]|nr:MAG: hypothetical protein DRI98_08065 [Bacteroidota bacterium]
MAGILFHVANIYGSVRLGRFDDNTEAERLGWTIISVPDDSWAWTSPINMIGWFIDDGPTGSCTSELFELDTNAKYIRLYHRGNKNENQYIQLLNESSNVLIQENFYPPDNDYYQRDLDISAYTGQIVKIRFIDNKSAGFGQMGVRNIRIVDVSGNTLLPFED